MNTKTMIGAPAGVELTTEASIVSIGTPMVIFIVGVIEDNGVVRSAEAHGLRPFFYTEAEARECRDVARGQGILADIVAITIASAELVV